jgi:cytidylate kinase
MIPVENANIPNRSRMNDGIMENGSFIVTIDGPAGSGKTTVSRLVAEKLGFDYVDTGALYRGVAYAAVHAKIELDDDQALEQMCRSLTIRLDREKDGLHLFINEVDVSREIRTPAIAMAASAVSARPVVRRFLLELQRHLGHHRKAVFEGRDMGTVVFPDAEVKFFLDADVKVRAKRRHRELAGNHNVTLEQVRRDMQCRDKNDSTRDVAPMKVASDAIYVDTADMSIDDVVGLISSTVAGRYRE